MVTGKRSLVQVFQTAGIGPLTGSQVLSAATVKAADIVRVERCSPPKRRRRKHRSRVEPSDDKSIVAPPYPDERNIAGVSTEPMPPKTKSTGGGVSNIAAAARLRADRRLLAAVDRDKSVLFLDIETTGLSRYYDEITLVGYMRDGRYHAYIRGDDPQPLLDALADADTLVTFNGTLFDVPFLVQTFEDAIIPTMHVDLRYAIRRTGLAGGQKALETMLGIDVRHGLEDIDGAEAVLLWHRYLRGDVNALKLLARYNLADVRGLCQLLDYVVDQVEHPDLWIEVPRFGETSASVLFDDLGSISWPLLRTDQARSSFRDVFGERPASRAVVVGIDLTGSELKPSGFCVLDGAHAKTKLVGTDDALIRETLAAKPDIVSIDSPLCLPRGRLHVGDDDPGRAEFGIMRESERTLKRRGINVYPCLLPSMQKLTARGIRLAEKLRGLGIPVIESYPGAAQDIMGIPRKGAGVQWLQRGLAEFGIDGDFADKLPSHDELDAITSALVGTFLLDGKFEGLGGEEESALVVPHLDALPTPLVIGLSGRIATGKTTAARWIEDRGFAYTRFSLVIDEEITRRGLPLDRATRQAIGFEIHRDRGQAWLCEQALRRVGDARQIVVDGLRWPQDRAYMVERFGNSFVHLHLTAPLEVRMARTGADSPETRARFLEAEAQPTESMIDQLGQFASHGIDNNASLEHFAAEITCFLEARAMGTR